MRIVLVTSSTNRSGGTRQAVYQARGLSAMGHDVTLCLPAQSSLWELPSDPLWYKLPEDMGQWRPAVEALLPWGPGIVHAFHNKAVKRVAWWGLFWRKRGIACVAHRGVIFRPGNPLPYLSPAMRAFIVNSQACAKAIGLHCPHSKIHVVPNGVPDARVTPTMTREAMRVSLGILPGELVFVYVGNDSPVKGADVIIKAFAAARFNQERPDRVCPDRVCPDRVRLVLVGTTKPRWEPLCRELGVENQVCHVGEVENVSDYLHMSDAFVFSTNLDSAPNTLLEAMRIGLPVIAAAVGGIPELVDGNGLLVPAKHVQAWASALQRMAAEPEQRALWAAQSLRLGQRYTVEARCKALESIYNAVLR